jgi:hypothetical protein
MADRTSASDGADRRWGRTGLLLGLVIVAVTSVAAWYLLSGREPPGWPDLEDETTAVDDDAGRQPTPDATQDEPVSSVRLEVGDDFQAVVDEHPPGTTYVIAEGVHRMQSVVPDDGDRFVGEPGAVLSGAKALDSSDFERSEDVWVIGGQTQQNATSGYWGCGDWRDHYYAECGHEQEVHFAEELFADGERLRHVNERSDVSSAGTWFFDYERDEIVMFDDPGTFDLLETSVIDTAFHGDGVRDVALENITVRHYANRAQRGAVDGENAVGWTVTFSEFRDNHGAGLRAGPGWHVSNIRAVHNGQIGVLARGMNDEDDFPPITIENSEIAHNRTLGFQEDWEAGGTKFARTTGMVFRNNWVHSHDGAKGVWFDIDNVDAVVHSNLVEHNHRAGIFYEISYGAEIYWNVVRHNHDPQYSGTERAGRGIITVDSPDVEVYENAVYANHTEVQGMHQTRHDGINGRTAVRNFTVRDNDIGLSGPWVGVMTCCDAATDPWTADMGNTFQGNTYRMPDSNYGYWWWDGEGRTRRQWQSFGQDQDSTFLPAEENPRLPEGATPFQQAHYGPR